MALTTHLQTFSQSLDRCLRNTGFVHAFYVQFKASSADVSIRFAHTDFVQHEPRITASLKTLAGAMAGDLNALKHLNERAESHSRNQLDIRPELYVLWKFHLIQTASRFDHRWSDEIEEAWDAVLTSAVDYMVKRY